MTEENTTTETTETATEVAAPQPTPAQVAMQGKLTQAYLEIGQGYTQDAARLLANIAGAIDTPLTFGYDTQGGGKALVFAVSGDSDLVTKIARVLEAVVAPTTVPASAAPAAEGTVVAEALAV